MLKHHETRTNWAVAIGMFALLGVGSSSWLSGLASGFGCVLVAYGAASYARGKGHHGALGGLLGAAWCAGAILYARSAGALPTLGAAVAVCALIGLVLLPARRRPQVA